MRIISLGEVLWDIFDDGELLGGAPLNFSASLQRLGHTAWLLTGIGADQRGDLTLSRMRELGLSTAFVQSTRRDTGTARVTLDSMGHAAFVIPRPAAFDSLIVDSPLLLRITELRGDWLYFGTLAQTEESNLALLRDIFRMTPSIRGFYDMNLRDGHWNLPLVQHLSTLAHVLKLNDVEAETLSTLVQPSEVFSLERFCRYWSSQHAVETICVTLGSQGCAVFAKDRLQHFPGYQVEVVDTVGAGDAFAAGFLHAMSRPWTLMHRAAFANALGALVASRAGATPNWTITDCEQMIANGRTTPARAIGVT